MWFEVNGGLLHAKVLSQQPQPLHRWAGNAGLQVVNVLQGGAECLGQLHRGLTALLA